MFGRMGVQVWVPLHLARGELLPRRQSSYSGCEERVELTVVGRLVVLILILFLGGSWQIWGPQLWGLISIGVSKR